MLVKVVLLGCTLHQMRYMTHRPPNARPTTMLPITAPEAKDTCRPREMEVRHASAVRPLADVAVYMPT